MGKYSKKERFLFWQGILIGLAGGVIGGLFSNSVFYFINKPFNNQAVILLGIFSILMIGVIWRINKNLKEIIKIKPGRPKNKK